MPTIQVEHVPQGQILSNYYYSWDRVELIMGPLGSGKTIESCQKMLTAIMCQDANPQGIRPSRWYAVRNTYSDLLTTTVKDWLGLFGELGTYAEGSKKPPTHTLDFDLPDGTTIESEIIFLALDRPDHVKKLRGAQATAFWLNEIKELNKAVVDMADLRHGRYPSMATGGVRPTWHGMIGDTNAPDEDHWYYELAENGDLEGWNFHRQPGGLFALPNDQFAENPNAENLCNLPDGYYVKGQVAKKKDWIKVNLCNEYGFVMDGKPVYPEYVDSVHCLTEAYTPDPALPIILGADFGRTPACAFIQFLPGIGRYVGFDEFVTTDMSAALFAPELKRYINRKYPNFEIKPGWGDPSGDHAGQATEDTPIKILRAQGVMFNPTSTNDPLIRRSSIVNPMTRLCMDGKPAFMISPACTNWRKGLAGGFCYKRVQVAGDDRFHDEPDKNKFSHICEAGEYGLQGSGEGLKTVTHTAVPQAPVVAKQDFDVFE